jgi:hypothetical protein
VAKDVRLPVLPWLLLTWPSFDVDAGQYCLTDQPGLYKKGNIGQFGQLIIKLLDCMIDKPGIIWISNKS